jgi:hypothetical protein
MLRTGAGSTGAGASRVESRESRAAVSVNAHLSTLSAPSTFNYQPSTLAQRAYARSGDKGTGANIGVAALTPEDYPWLVEWLTAERVERFFHSLGVTKVERHLLPNLQAMNFVLQGILQRSLRSDAQGKTLGQALLEMPVEER